MCSGRVDLEFVFRAFANGMDGVFIGGCRLNECNYITHGNYHALSMVSLSKKIMEFTGLNTERLKIELMTSGDGILFAEVINDFSKKIKKIGPLGKPENMEQGKLKEKINKIRKLIPYIKIAKRDKLEARLARKREYENLFTKDEIETLFREIPSYYIDPDKCKACMICTRRCPVDAIDGGKKKIHIIDQDKCIKCGSCFAACPDKFGAVQKIIGKPAPPPVSEEKRIIAKKAKA